MKNDDLISRSALLAAYDSVHVGQLGGDRKLIEDAPAVDIGPMWADLEYEDPVDGEEYLVIVSGKPMKNITLDHAYQLGSWLAGEGWVIDEYPEWENPTVHAWMDLPDPPEVDEVCEACRITYRHERDGEPE